MSHLIPTEEETNELVTQLHMMLTMIFKLEVARAVEVVMIHPEGFKEGIVLDFTGTIAGTYWLLAPTTVTEKPGWQLLRQEVDYSTNAVGFKPVDMEVHKHCLKMVADAIYEESFNYFEMEYLSPQE